MGAPNQEPQQYNRNIPTRVLIFYYVPTIFLGVPVGVLGLGLGFILGCTIRLCVQWLTKPVSMIVAIISHLHSHVKSQTPKGKGKKKKTVF